MQQSSLNRVMSNAATAHQPRMLSMLRSKTTPNLLLTLPEQRHQSLRKISKRKKQGKMDHNEGAVAEGSQREALLASRNQR